MALDVFREMTVEGSPEQLLAFIEDVSKRLTDGWRRNLPAEADTFGDDPRYAFTCDVDDVRGRAGATIHIMQQDDAALRVMNIVPTVNVALEFLGYNRILVEFHDAFAKPAAEVLGLELSLTDDLYRLEDHISPKTHDQLRAFSREANRGVPFASDQERWRRALLSPRGRLARRFRDDGAMARRGRGVAGRPCLGARHGGRPRPVSAPRI